MLLAGDIGGTKTILAIFSSEAGARTPLAQAIYHSADYESLEAMARVFLASEKLPVDRASFGVAGPVIEGRATITNLPWVMDEATLRQELGLQWVRLLNDLYSLACAVPILQADDLSTLNAGEKVPGGAIAVIAPGTGLGEAYLTWNGSRYQPHPSEGGHADFAPATPDEVGLVGYLFQRYSHVSYERVCSGIGLPHIYAYLKESGYAPEPAWLAAQLAATGDPTPAIVNAALRSPEPDPLCLGVLNTFVSILGSQAGNLALHVLATGGVYLGGGIPPRILPALQGKRFMEAFANKGRMEQLLARVPVHVILHPQVGLLGAASYGLNPEQYD